MKEMNLFTEIIKSKISIIKKHIVTRFSQFRYQNFTFAFNIFFKIYLEKVTGRFLNNYPNSQNKLR